MLGFGDNSSSSLEYNFYRYSCPHAEPVVGATVRHVHRHRPKVASSLIRLAFHDCFIQGCHASILLLADDGIDSEKESPPNETLKGFDAIEMIESKFEEACLGVVSCADILVLAARDSVFMAGGPLYPLYTGRRDGSISFFDPATGELLSPWMIFPKLFHPLHQEHLVKNKMVALLGLLLLDFPPFFLCTNVIFVPIFVFFFLFIVLYFNNLSKHLLRVASSP